MNKIFTTVSVVAVTALAAPAAMAASIMIDDFNTAQAVEDVPGLNANDSTVLSPPGDFWGDSRRMTVATNPNNGAQPVGGSSFQSTGTTGFPSPGILQFNNDDGQFGIASLTYTFAGGDDLTDGGTNDKFFFALNSFDIIGAAFFQLTVFDGAFGSGTFTENLDAAFDPYLKFSDVVGGVDFTNVTSLLFEIESTTASFDGSLASISVVPLPASALLLLGGLGGFAGVSAAAKRRRRKT
jgi:hypothetical protein